ncbi:retrovirus-related pol polyprotein from transposon TNT 1-94, partial [Tanacetum coccineum]
MRYSLPCKVDGQRARDTELDLVDLANYVTEKVLDSMGFVHVSISDYGRKMVNDVNVEIHEVKFKADFVVLDYANEGEPSIIQSSIVKEVKQFDLLEEIGRSSEEVVKMGKANRNKGYNINKLTPPPSLKLVGIPSTSTIPPQPIYYPLTSKQREKMKEVLDIRYKELEESKHIIEVLENYVIYKKKLDEILIGKERLNKKDFSEEDKVGIIEHGLLKKICDPENYVLPVKINGVVGMVALVDTGVSVSVFPYSLYKDLRLGDPRPYQTNLIIADNTQAKAMGEVKNVRIQIGYQAYEVDLLVLEISVDPELPLLLGRPFLRTCCAIIDMGRGTLCIDDEVIHYTYFPKPRSKSYVETFEMEGEDVWLGNFEVGRDEDGNRKYGPVAPSFLDIEDDMERALAMEAYFNPFKSMIMFKKLVDFLGLLPVQLKKIYWGNEGYGTYKKIDGDGIWHARFEIVTPSGRKFNRAFNTKTTTRKLSRKFTTEDKIRKDTLPNPLIAEYEKRNKKNTITYSIEALGYEGYGDVFVDYSWERALLINDEVYPEWVLELFSTMYFDKDVDKINLMKEKCIWFRLCGNEHILTLPEFAVVLGLFTEDEVNHQFFGVHFGKLEVDDRQFNHREYWTKVGKPTLTNHKEVLVNEPLMRIHALGTKESSVICVGHYVTKIASSLGYCVDDEIKKCSEPIDCEYWTTKMLAEELDEKNQCLLKETRIPTQAGIGSSEQRQEPRGLNTSWGDWNASLNEVECGNVWRDSMLIRNNYMLEHSMPILHHLADQ